MNIKTDLEQMLFSINPQTTSNDNTKNTTVPSMSFNELTSKHTDTQNNGIFKPLDFTNKLQSIFGSTEQTPNNNNSVPQQPNIFNISIAMVKMIIIVFITSTVSILLQISIRNSRASFIKPVSQVSGSSEIHRNVIWPSPASPQTDPACFPLLVRTANRWPRCSRG